MAAVLPEWEAQPAGEPEPVWRVSVDKYHEMIAAGVLTEDDDVELLEGLIVPRMSKKPPHSGFTSDLMTSLLALLPEGWRLRVQEPITLDDSEPEPDLAVVRGDRKVFRQRHPRPDEIGLVVEVSESTLRRDRITKQRIYSRAGIPFYWIFNLNANQLEVYSRPEPNSGYATCEVYSTDSKAPLVLPGAKTRYLDLSEFLTS